MTVQLKTKTVQWYKTIKKVNVSESVFRTILANDGPLTIAELHTAINDQISDAAYHVSRSHVGSKASMWHSYYSDIHRIDRGVYCRARTAVVYTQRCNAQRGAGRILFGWLSDPNWWTDGTLDDIIRDFIGEIRDRTQQEEHKRVPFIKVWGFSIGWDETPLPITVPNKDSIEVTEYDGGVWVPPRIQNPALVDYIQNHDRFFVVYTPLYPHNNIKNYVLPEKY